MDIMKYFSIEINIKRMFKVTIYTSIGSSLMVALLFIWLVSDTTTEEIDFFSVDFLSSFVSMFFHIFISSFEFIIFSTLIITIVVIFAFFSFRQHKNDTIIVQYIGLLTIKHDQIFRWLLLILFVMLLVNIGPLLFQFPDSITEWTPTLQALQEGIFRIAGLTILVLLIVARVNMNALPKLSSALANEIAPEQIVREPTAAIRNAFVFFEQRLRNIMGTDSSNSKESVSNLIGKAFKEGILVHEKPEAVRDLMKGTYGLYRNPLMHEDPKYSTQQAHYILMLVDDLVKKLDESELRQSE